MGITIGWNYSQKEDVSLDAIGDNDNAGKTKLRKKVDPDVRCEMLRSAGYTNSEILQSDRRYLRQLKRAQSDLTLMRGSAYANSKMRMAVQEHENAKNFAYSNDASLVHGININQLHLPNNANAVTLNQSLGVESNVLSMKSNEVLND